MSDEANERLSPQSLMRAYTDGHNHVTEVYAAVLKSGDYVWIKTDVSLVTSFNSSDVIAFSTIQIFQIEMTMKMILESIMHFEYDEITCIYLKNDSYSIMAGKSATPDLAPTGVYSKACCQFSATLLQSRTRRHLRSHDTSSPDGKMEEQQPFFYRGFIWRMDLEATL